MSGSNEVLRNAVSAFLESCGRDYEFPAGGQHELLTSQEQVLLELLRACGWSVEQQVSALEKDHDWSDCYSLVIFGVRLAILAVRQTQPSIYRIGLVALVAGSPKVDWRDVLGASLSSTSAESGLASIFKRKLNQLPLAETRQSCDPRSTVSSRVMKI